MLRLLLGQGSLFVSPFACLDIAFWPISCQSCRERTLAMLFVGERQGKPLTPQAPSSVGTLFRGTSRRTEHAVLFWLPFKQPNPLIPIILFDYSPLLALSPTF